LSRRQSGYPQKKNKKQTLPLQKILHHPKIPNTQKPLSICTKCGTRNYLEKHMTITIQWGFAIPGKPFIWEILAQLPQELACTAYRFAAL